jgi:flavin reductase (DIM6/NTAB) family NADH-FMN oxidoreductase RutF
MDMSSAIDPMELRRCLGAFVTGVTVITTLDEHGVLQGMTVNSFNSVSLDPPLIVWSLRTNSASFNAYSKAPRFVVNILAPRSDQRLQSVCQVEFQSI